jgi:1,4-alpha-glucan branching enzyme
MPNGYLALVLHAHLPFVRHPEHEHFLEEDWLFESITETYIPLIAMMRRLVSDGVRFNLTMSVTPTLCAMLQDDLLRDRYLRYLESRIALAERLSDYYADERLRNLARFYSEQFSQTRRRFVDDYDRDLVGALRELQQTGSLEIIACAATHAYLPLLQQTPQSMRAQVLIGCDVYRAMFGCEPRGIWLPECGYAPEVDPILQEANLRWFVVDSHGLMFGTPRPRFAIYAPCYTPAGPAAFARDRESSREVWSATEGYPGDPSYRDFYRDVGFDLEPDQLTGFLAPNDSRKFTGLKFHRVTGAGEPKDHYDPQLARATAERHAEDFVAKRRQQSSRLAEGGFEPIIVAPFDAELFGHWWYEGPVFLEAVIRAIATGDTIGLVTPTEYLRAHPTQQVIAPAASSWGHNGSSEMWLNEQNAWIYPRLDAAGRQMAEVAAKYWTGGGEVTERALKQLARELLLAQASDWAFLIKTGTAIDYATGRTNEHLLRFGRLYEQVMGGGIDQAFLAEREARHNLFPDVNWRHYAADHG